jgi:transcriptional regulator with XRE-family HTH domain
MAKTDMETGPTGQTVAENMKRLYKNRGLTLVQLSERTEQAGRGLSVSALSLIATGKRRVDVDDLMVLAVALDVSPISLLLPVASPRRKRQKVGATGFPTGVTPEQLLEFLSGGQHPFLLDFNELSRDQQMILMFDMMANAKLSKE